MQRKKEHKMVESPGRGWFGDPEGHARAGAIGGRAWKKGKRKKINVRTK